MGLVCLFSTAALPAQSVREPVRSLAKLHRLEDDVAARGLGVELDATVTFVHPLFNWMFVSQAGDPAFVFGIAPFRDALYVGWEVKLTGKTAVGEVRPYINCEKITAASVRHSAHVTPRRVAMSTLTVGEHDSAVVETEGTIRLVTLEPLSSTLLLEDDGCRFLVTIATPQSADAADRLAGARVRVRGNLGYRVSRERYHVPNPQVGRVLAFEIFVPDDSGLDVLVPSPKNHRVVTKTDLRGLSEVDLEVGGAAVKGQVTYVEAGDIIIEDERAAQRVRWTSEGAEIGDVLRLFVTGPHEDVPFRARVLQRVDNSPLSSPRRTRGDRLAKLEPFRRAMVEGTIVHRGEGDDDGPLILEDEGIRIGVHFSGALPLEQFVLETARRLRVVGPLCPASSPSHDFRVLVARAADVEVVEREATLPIKALALWAGGIASVFLAAILWIWTLRRRVEEKTRDLSDLTTRLRASYDAIEEGILVLDLNGRVLALNRAALNLIPTPVMPGDTGERILESWGLERETPLHHAWTVPMEVPIPPFDMRIFGEESTLLRWSATPIVDDSDPPHLVGRLWIIGDETERAEFERRLTQAQKMEAVGSLASGVAHDFNNLLAVIIGNLSLVDGEVQDDRLRLAVQNCLGASMTASEVVKKLLSFSRTATLQLKPLNISEVARRAADFLSFKREHDIAIDVDFQSEIPAVLGDAVLLEQVALNLYLNAIDAMPNGGKLIVRTVADHERGMALLSVRDEGIGMSPEILERVFDPYFTSKPVGRGTGLGLSVSYNTIKMHGGELTCESWPGVGTVFEASLPFQTVARVPAAGPPGRRAAES